MTAGDACRFVERGGAGQWAPLRENLADQLEEAFRNKVSAAAANSFLARGLFLGRRVPGAGAT